MAEIKTHNNELKEEEERKVEVEEPKDEQVIVSSKNDDEEKENVLEQAVEEEVKEQIKPEEEETTAGTTTTATTVTTAEEQHVQNPSPQQTNLSGNGRILKEAFPDVENDIIEAILQSQNGNVDGSFELLLGMSDPNYKSTPPPPEPEAATQVMEQDDAAPPMPPRPNSNNNWQNQAPSGPLSIEEQLRMDEELAKKIHMEDERRLQRRTSQQRQQQQSQQRREQNNNSSDDDLFANFQEELPVIKEKMKEAGNAAKKKVMDLYNQFKANRNMNNNQSEATSSIPTTNAHYRGLPSDDGDDLLTGDVSALRLSDYDVYTQTAGGRTRKSSDFNEKNDGVIYVNPSLESNEQQPKTSTSDAQLRADEEFARQLAEGERREARQTEQQEPPQIPARRSINKPTVVIAPRSPLEMEGDSDYEDVGLTATAATKEKKEDNTTVPYVIGDDDDSDSDDLVDIEEEEHKSKTPQKSDIK